MHPTTPQACGPVDLLLLAALATAQALAVLIAAAVALLLLAGWRPAGPPAAAPAPAAPLPPAPAAPPTAPLHRPASPERVTAAPLPGDALAGLRVVELRARARAAGLPQLGRSGRRAELLAALSCCGPSPA